MKSALSLGLLGLLGLLGCSAPAACVEERWTSPPNLESETLSGSVTLEQTSGTARRSFNLVLSNLPVLWQDDNVFGGGVTLSLSTEYEGEPKGNDGKTQMPRVSATLVVDGTELSKSTGTGQFAAGTVEGEELPLFFNGCDHEGKGPGCCEYGARECSLPLSLALKRLDAAPFPTVVATWTAKANANATSCPLSKDLQAQISFSEAP